MPFQPQNPQQSSFLGAAQGGAGLPMQPPSSSPQQGQPQQPQGLPPQMMAMLKQVAGMGRHGDTVLAHLTPGEKTVPPEVQTPKVLATLNKAYKDKGVSPEQFTVGSPQSSINPATQLPEYNFLSAFLPTALGLAGSIAFPALAPAMLGGNAMAAAAIGSGLGTTAGGLLAGQDPMQAGLSGLGSGLGGYMVGNMFSPAKDAATAAASSAPAAANAAKMTPMPGSLPSTSGLGMSSAANALPSTAGAAQPPLSDRLSSAFSDAWKNPNLAFGAGSLIGGQVGNYLGAPVKTSAAPRPSGFNDKMRPVGELPPWDQQLGMTNYRGPTANFSGFDPATNYPAAWRFF